jgi:hypothetical protein
MKKIVKLPGIIIIILIVLTVLIRLVLPMVAVELANRTLPGILKTEVSIGSVSLGLLRGYVSIRDIRIAQPQGFGEGNLLKAPEFSVKVDLYSLLSPPLTVEEVSLTDWEVNIVKNADGVMNIDAIQSKSSPGQSPLAEPEIQGEQVEGKKISAEGEAGAREDEQEEVKVEDELSEEVKEGANEEVKKEEMTEEEDAKEEESPSKPILLRKFTIKNLSCSYTDHALALEHAEAGEELGEGEFSELTDGAGVESVAAVPPGGEAESGGENFIDFTDLPEGEEEFGVLTDIPNGKELATVPDPPDEMELNVASPVKTVSASPVPDPSHVADPTPDTKLKTAATADSPPAVFSTGTEPGETVDLGKPDEDGDEEEVLRIQFTSLNLLLTDLLIDPMVDPASVEPASALLTARIVQAPFSDGLLGIDARIGPIGGGMPAVNAVLRLADLELEPIEVVVPDGAAQILGGSALDISADLALASYLLDCELEIEVSGGHHLSLPIGGTPDKPEVDTSSILFGVMLHFGGGLGNLAGNIGGAGYHAAAMIGETTWAVGEGTANVFGSIGGGLFKTVTSAATGDLDGAVEGLSDTTVGTANEAASAGGNVAEKSADRATATAHSTTGEDADREWRADTPNRWQKSWDEARQLLTEMPFPPLPREETEAVISPTPVAERTPAPVIEGDDENFPAPLPDEFGGEEPF